MFLAEARRSAATLPADLRGSVTREIDGVLKLVDATAEPDTIAPSAGAVMFTVGGLRSGGGGRRIVLNSSYVEPTPLSSAQRMRYWPHGCACTPV